LKIEHRQYAEDLRLVGTRSGALIERLIEQLMKSAMDHAHQDAPPSRENSVALSSRTYLMEPNAESGVVPKPVSLRRIVERCSGLLSRVAGGRAIEITYGEAAAVPVSVAEEAVERILVNLVRNAAAALEMRESAGDPEMSLLGDAGSEVSSHQVPSSFSSRPAPIHIGVGLLVNRVGDAKPWPFRRVRLTVEDAGCGMGG